MAMASSSSHPRGPPFFISLLLILSHLLSTAPLSIAAAQHSSTFAGASASFSSHWRTGRSLLQSLLHRIVNHRLARGDIPGAERVRTIISSVDSGVSFWKNAGLIGWDYLIHYSWRHLEPSQFIDIARLVNDLQSAIGELLQLPSDSERLQWVSNNYGRVLQTIKSVLQKLLNLFDHSGALQNFVLALQKEIVSGDILRDALQLGAADLQGLVQVAKDMFQSYSASSAAGTHSEL